LAGVVDVGVLGVPVRAVVARPVVVVTKSAPPLVDTATPMTRRSFVAGTTLLPATSAKLHDAPAHVNCRTPTPKSATHTSAVERQTNCRGFASVLATTVVLAADAHAVPVVELKARMPLLAAVDAT